MRKSWSKAPMLAHLGCAVAVLVYHIVSQSMVPADCESAEWQHRILYCFRQAARLSADLFVVAMALQIAIHRRPLSPSTYTGLARILSLSAVVVPLCVYLPLAFTEAPRTDAVLGT